MTLEDALVPHSRLGFYLHYLGWHDYRTSILDLIVAIVFFLGGEGWLVSQLFPALEKIPRDLEHNDDLQKSGKTQSGRTGFR